MSLAVTTSHHTSRSGMVEAQQESKMRLLGSPTVLSKGGLPDRHVFLARGTRVSHVYNYSCNPNPWASSPLGFVSTCIWTSAKDFSNCRPVYAPSKCICEQEKIPNRGVAMLADQHRPVCNRRPSRRAPSSCVGGRSIGRYAPSREPGNGL